MTSTAADPRFRRGVELFNAGEYFDAHEVWEHLWRECNETDRRFVQSLIHAAVALYQLGRANVTAASTQFARGAAKAREYPPTFLGVDSRALWGRLNEVLTAAESSVAVQIHWAADARGENA